MKSSRAGRSLRTAVEGCKNMEAAGLGKLGARQEIMCVFLNSGLVRNKS